MSNVIITAFRYTHDTGTQVYNFISCRYIKKILKAAAAADGVMKRTPWLNEWKGEPFYNFLIKKCTNYKREPVFKTQCSTWSGPEGLW